MQSYKAGYVISKDGTVIGYRELGKGPGLVIVHGGMQSAQNFMKLAEALADRYTLYLPDRRGRGLSGEPGPVYGLEKECEDIDALLNKTGAHFIFGLSSGAIISLNAALKYPAIHRAAIYEPPFPIDPTTPDYRFMSRYNREVAEDNLGAASVTVVKGLGFSGLLKFAPRFIMVPLVNLMLKKEKPKEGDVSLKHLVTTFKYDRILVADAGQVLDKFKSVKAEVLLLGGSKSPRFLKKVLDNLSMVLPKRHRIEFKGLDHMGSDNSGQPRVVAEGLHKFFSGHKD